MSSTLFTSVPLCVYVCKHMHVHTMVSEDNLPRIVLTFYYMVPRDQAQVLRFDGKHLYQPSHCAGPWVYIFLNKCSLILLQLCVSSYFHVQKCKDLGSASGLWENYVPSLPINPKSVSRAGVIGKVLGVKRMLRWTTPNSTHSLF